MTALTNEELAEIEKRHEHENNQHGGTSSHDIYNQRHKDRRALLAHIRSQTPPQAVTPTQDEMFVRCYLYDSVATFNTYADMHRAKATPEGDEKAKRNEEMAKRGYEAFRKYMALAEKPAPTVTPLTNEERAEIEKRHEHENNQHGGTSSHDIYNQRHKDRRALRAHIRSPTPPQAVTREDIARVLAGFHGWDFDKLQTWHNAVDGQLRYLERADAILELLAEKPATTVTPLTEEERAVIEWWRVTLAGRYNAAELFAILDREFVK